MKSPHELDETAPAPKPVAPRPVPVELLVLCEHGLRVGIPGHYGLFDEAASFEVAVARAREMLARGHALAFVTFRIEAHLVDGGHAVGTECEVLRFQVFRDRVVRVPPGQGGLTSEQEEKVHALDPTTRTWGKALL